MNFVFTRMRKKRIIILIVLIFLAFIPDGNIEEVEFPLYRVIVDPGHGGVYLGDKKLHGDKFDMISATYLDYFAEGAIYRGIYEKEIVYKIAVKALKILSNCSKDGDFDQFKKIMKKYTSGKINKIYIETKLSRGESIKRDELRNNPDPNGEFRLYDYPSAEGKMLKGRISKMNEYKPHLIVSLHLAKTAPPDYRGMNGIIVPPYNVLKKGFDMLKSGEPGISFDDSNILNSWFKVSSRVSYRLAFLSDASQYFTSYKLKRNFTINGNDFNGYKYNMVQWRYSDREYWDVSAEKHPPNTRYSSSIKTFNEEGAFWDREKSVYEEYRRGTGFRDFGGDNYYATYEIIKYVLYSLNQSGVWRRDKVPGKPFVSTWSVPMLVNAISAYIELGYLDRKWDKSVLLYRQDEIAEGVAVGIYSLLAGVEDVKGNFKYKPSGKSIDLKKYTITKDKTYFDIVTE